MAVPVIKPSDIKLSDKLLVTWLTVGVSVIPMIGWLYVQRQFCPSEALLAGYVEATIGYLGAFFITVCVSFFISMGIVFGKKPAMTRPRSFRIACVVLASLTLALWSYILSSYACVDAKGFSLHSSPLEKPTTYGWSDIRSATPICKYRSSRSIAERHLKLRLEMKDGHTVTLGFPESRIRPHHAELRAHFVLLPRGSERWGYNWAFYTCPDDYADLFAPM